MFPKTLRLLLLSLVAATGLVGTQALARPQAAHGSRCTASELRPSADWQGVNTTRTGGVGFSARKERSCTLRGRPRIALYSRGRRLDVGEDRYPALGDALDTVERTVVVAPGHTAGAAFDWVNWCGKRVQAPMILVVTLPQGAGRLSMYVRYGYLRHSVTSPDCLATSQPSTIYVGYLRPVTATTQLP